MYRLVWPQPPKKCWCGLTAPWSPDPGVSTVTSALCLLDTGCQATVFTACNTSVRSQMPHSARALHRNQTHSHRMVLASLRSRWAQKKKVAFPFLAQMLEKMGYAEMTWAAGFCQGIINSVFWFLFLFCFFKNTLTIGLGLCTSKMRHQRVSHFTCHSFLNLNPKTSLRSLPAHSLRSQITPLPPTPSSLILICTQEGC